MKTFYSLKKGVCELEKSSFFISASNNCNQTNLIRLTEEISAQDIRCIGYLALEIFTTHIKNKNKSSPSPSPRKSSSSTLTNMMLNEQDYFFHLNELLEHIENDIQKDFILKCLSAGRVKLNIYNIYNHPFVNTIESLRVLSVFSIFSFFQEKKQINYDSLKTDPIKERKLSTINQNSKIDEFFTVNIKDQFHNSSSSLIITKSPNPNKGKTTIHFRILNDFFNFKYLYSYVFIFTK
jgi:hypothetical protein